MTTLTDRIAGQMNAQREADLRTLTARILHTNRLIRMLRSAQYDMIAERDRLISTPPPSPFDAQTSRLDVRA